MTHVQGSDNEYVRKMKNLLRGRSKVRKKIREIQRS